MTDLSIPLVRPLSVPVPLPHTIEALPAFLGGNMEGDACFYSNIMVALCMDAVLFCQPDMTLESDSRYGRNRIKTWETLVRAFDDWYRDRPIEFQAVLELYPRDGQRSDDEFPTLLFASGYAILANQLYHTGMLTLLQNRPRFLGRTGRKSSSMAVPWHMHRICGIAINNDRRECWDPSLLASFLAAARLATHPSQHKSILNSLTGVQKLTGWNISQDLEILRREWRLAEN